MGIDPSQEKIYVSIYGNEMVHNMGIDPSQEIIYVIDMVPGCTFNLEPN